MVNIGAGSESAFVEFEYPLFSHNLSTSWLSSKGFTSA